jgi:tetrahydromethanopterin S-methyltransferase subunit D
VFVTAPGADLAAAAPTLANVPVRGVSAYLTPAAGTYQVRVVPAGTAPAARAASVAINVASLVLAAGANRTIVAADRSQGGTPLQAFVLADR